MMYIKSCLELNIYNHLKGLGLGKRDWEWVQQFSGSSDGNHSRNATTLHCSQGGQKGRKNSCFYANHLFKKAHKKTLLLSVTWVIFLLPQILSNEYMLVCRKQTFSTLQNLLINMRPTLLTSVIVHNNERGRP